VKKALGWAAQQMHIHKNMEVSIYHPLKAMYGTAVLRLFQPRRKVLQRLICCAGGFAVASFTNPVGAVQAERQSDRTLPSIPSAEVLQDAPVLLSQSFGDTLRLGDSGEAVTQLQLRLAELGYFDGPTSGIFGQATEAAVIQFQQDNRLEADGIVGPATQSALGVTPVLPDSASSLLSRGSSGEAVTRLQARLAELGYFQGEPTGNFGSATEAAVIQFQRANRLTDDGVVGAATADALYGAFSPAPPPPAQSFAVPSSVAANPNDGILRRGDVGTDVTNLQQRLSALGYYQGSIDGDFGEGTEAAVLQFQRQNNLVPDGIAGPVTLSAINNARLPNAITQVPNVAGQPSGRFSVLELQRRLQRRGFYSGPLDGELGTGTRQAIAAAQRAYQLTEDDILNGRFR
jgi:peptidoglycan hydrolase-like protein with peptidoglycan-binding domain